MATTAPRCRIRVAAEPTARTNERANTFSVSGQQAWRCVRRRTEGRSLLSSVQVEQQRWRHVRLLGSHSNSSAAAAAAALTADDASTSR